MENVDFGGCNMIMYMTKAKGRELCENGIFCGDILVIKKNLLATLLY